MVRKNVKKILIGFGVFVFWIGAWYLLALIIDNLFLLPMPHTTLLALFKLMKSAEFYNAVACSLLRVIAGVVFGALFGTFLAFLSYKITAVRRIFSPLVSIVKATPVVAFITLLWITLSGNALTVFIAFLMVAPIIWQNLLSGLDEIPGELSELCDAFELSSSKRFKLLTLPVLINYLFPALITSIGLAWKAEIATEIITYTKNSIGQNMSDARYFLLTDEVFAWVAVIIVFSISLELLTKKILGRFKR